MIPTDPSSAVSAPATGQPEAAPPTPRRVTPHLKPIAAALTALVLVLSFVAVFALAQGAHGGAGAARPGLASGPTATTATAVETASPAPSATAAATAPADTVRVTQNQDYRYECLNRPQHYTVALLNPAQVSATYHIIVPYPYWAGLATAGDGSRITSGTIAAGGSGGFDLYPQAGYPCTGVTYHATIQVRFADGRSQPDIPLTYAGSGPEPYAHLVVTENQDYVESCPDGVAPPPPYRVTIQNTGNARAYPYGVGMETTPPGTPWAKGTNDLVGATWIEPGQSMHLYLTPQTWIGCGAATYHLEMRTDTWQGTTQSVMLTDTIR